MATAPCLNIVGDRVALGPVGRALSPLIARWLSDFGTQRTLGGLPLPRTLEAVATLGETLAARDDAAEFAIHTRDDADEWHPIGIVELQAIDRLHGTAELVIFIGEAALRGRGYGTEATRLTLGYAFDTLGLHSIGLHAYEYNLAGLRAYERAGFRAIGRRRACHWLGGRFWDAILMECLATEFVGTRSAR